MLVPDTYEPVPSAFIHRILYRAAKLMPDVIGQLDLSIHYSHIEEIAR